MAEAEKRAIKVSLEIYNELSEESEETGRTINEVLEDRLNAKNGNETIKEIVAETFGEFTPLLDQKLFKHTETLTTAISKTFQKAIESRQRRHGPKEEKEKEEEPEDPGKPEELKELNKEILTLTDPTLKKLDIVHTQLQKKLEKEQEEGRETCSEARKNMLLALGYSRATKSFLRRITSNVFITEED